jgi:hypothetical protein
MATTISSLAAPFLEKEAVLSHEMHDGGQENEEF